MATPNIVPRADSEGNLGTSSLFWLRSYLDGLTIGNDAAGTIVFAPEAGDTVTLASAASGAFSITTVDGGGLAGHISLVPDGDINLDCPIGGNINLDAHSGITINSLFVTQSSALDGGVANYPMYRLKSTANNVRGGMLQFWKDRGAAAVNADEIGIIEFQGENDAQELTKYAQILVETSEVDDTDEAGKMSFLVAESNGTTSQLTAGLVLEGEHATDGEVDVTIAAGAGSTTTVSGDLTVTGDVIMVANLPTSDPSNAGQLWNDSNTIKVSAG